MDWYINLLESSEKFTTLDANLGCRQIEMDGEDMDKTDSAKYNGINCYVMTPLGLRNMEMTFQAHDTSDCKMAIRPGIH